jgi:hypothetical protein
VCLCVPVRACACLRMRVCGLCLCACVMEKNDNRHTPLVHAPPVCASKRFVAMASISSMKMIEGEFSFAMRNTSRTMRGPSPRYFCTNSEPTTLRGRRVRDGAKQAEKEVRKTATRTPLHISARTG